MLAGRTERKMATQAENAVITKCVQGINHVLDTYGAQMDPYDKEFLRKCVSRAQAIVDGRIQQAEELLKKGRRWQKAFTAPIQTELFTEKGEFVEDAEAKEQAKAEKKAQKQKDKASKGKGKASNVVNLDEKRKASQGIDPKDGEQLPLTEEGQVTNANGTTMTWRLAPGVPKAVEMGLVQAVQDEGNQKKAIKAVAKATKRDEVEIGGYWDKLVAVGRLELVEANGRKYWVANLPQDQPVAAVSG